jgi:hypothetical protein
MAEVLVPVSVGELIDKITILRIKMREIKDQNKLVNISKELSALESVCTKNGIDLTNSLVAQLESVNSKLWKIEDDIRDKERAKTFDSGFIELARAVYVVNDERFAVKNMINKEFGSAFQEEKSYKPY